MTPARLLSAGVGSRPLTSPGSDSSYAAMRRPVEWEAPPVRLPNKSGRPGDETEDYTLNMLIARGRRGTRVRIRPRIMTTPTLGLVGCSGGVGPDRSARRPLFGIVHPGSSEHGQNATVPVCGSSAAGKTFPGSRPVISCENGERDQHARRGGSRRSARQAFETGRPLLPAAGRSAPSS